MKRTWPFLLGLVLFAAPAAVQAQFTYTTNSGGITLAAYTGTGAAVVISNFVTTIGAGAFEDSTNLTSVTIPESVTNLGDYAFYDCPNLGYLYFEGDAPSADSTVFDWDNYPVVYYVLGTSGWAGFSTNTMIYAEDEYAYTTNASGITITRYLGPGGSSDHSLNCLRHACRQHWLRSLP